MRRIKRGPYAYPVLPAEGWMDALLDWSNRRGWSVKEIEEKRRVSATHVQLKVKVEIPKGGP